MTFFLIRFYFFQSTESMYSTPSTPTTPQTPEPFEIKLVNSNDMENVLEFLRRFFFRDEPLNVNIELLTSEDATCLELEEYSVKCIKDNLSLMAVSESGKIVGVCLNGAQLRDQPHEDEEECPNPKFAKIVNLLETVEKNVDIFSRFVDVNKIICVKILSVDGSWRGRGVAKELMDKTR